MYVPSLGAVAVVSVMVVSIASVVGLSWLGCLILVVVGLSLSWLVVAADRAVSKARSKGRNL